MSKLNYKLLNLKEDSTLINFADTIIVIRNFNEFLKYDFVFKDDVVINEAFFKMYSLIALSFFDASLPKRIIKEVLYNEPSIHIITNKKDVKESTMDIRHYLYMIRVPNFKFNKVTYE